MHAGRSREKTLARAQANVDMDGKPRYIHIWAGVYGIEQTPWDRAETVLPITRKENQ